MKNIGNINGKNPLETKVVNNKIITTYKDYKITTQINLPNLIGEKRKNEIFENEIKNNIQIKLRNMMYVGKLGGSTATRNLPIDLFEKERVFHYIEGIGSWKRLETIIEKPKGITSPFKEMGCGIVGFLTPSIIQFENKEVPISSIIFIQEIEDYK